MTEAEILWPASAARRLGVRTLVVIEAMYERRLPRVRMSDGTLGIPASELDGFRPEVSAET